MRYHHTFKVRAPIHIVSDFHTRSASMGAITPPPVIVRVNSAPEILGEGDRMDFTLWIGLLPVHWIAIIESCTPNDFKDRQLSGPFAYWSHHHSFVPVDENHTEVIDQVTFSIKKHPFWGLVGLGMGISLPLLFTFRGWKTRRLLEQNRSVTTQKTSQTGKSQG